MRIARFAIGDTVAYGIVESAGDSIADSDPEIARIRPIRGMPFGGELEPAETTFPLPTGRFLPPVLPSKIVGIGKNYLAHAQELGAYAPEEPLMFLKPNTTVVGPGASIVLPSISERVDFEGELAVVIGALCRNVAVEDADMVIGGYTCANDVTARDLQMRDTQWTRAKGFDTFAPLGPWIETTLDTTQAQIQTSVNGEVRQAAAVADLVFGIPQIIAHVSAVMTLLPGDVILTGTPAGIGPLQDQDEVSVTVTGIGTLSNDVRLGD